MPITGSGYIVELSGGVPRSVCHDCTLYGFLSDNRRILVISDDAHVIRVLDTTTGRGDVLVQGAEQLDRSHDSPDDRWLAFGETRATVRKSFLVPLAPGQPPARERWQQVDESTTTGRPTGWSVDSRVLYLLLDTDGFRCLWGQHVDPVSGRLEGQPYPVRHLHQTGGASTSFGNAVTAEGFMYERTRTTQNLWRLVAPHR